MLIEFRVSNFRSFRDEQVFSMVASADKELPDNLITDKALGKNRLLRSAVMYGANASGKSNFVKALKFMQDFVLNSANREIGADIPMEPFIFDKSHQNKPSKFSLSFIHEKIRYQYSFEIDRKRIIFEELIAYPKNLPQVWYSRKYIESTKTYEFKPGASLKGARSQILRLTREDVLFLSNGAKLNNPQLRKVYDWFNEFLDIVDTTQKELTNPMSKMIAEEEVPFFRTLSTAWLQIADSSIKDIISVEKSHFDASLGSRYEVSIGRDASNESSEKSYIPIEDESLGIQKFYSTIVPLLATFIIGSVVIIDELDSSLHPLLVRGIITLMHQNELEKSRGQLIFNTHDTTLLDGALLRRDQIWFVEKNNKGASELFSLLDFSPRKTESFARGYLQGRYGAIPFLEGVVQFLENFLDVEDIERMVQNGKAKAS